MGKGCRLGSVAKLLTLQTWLKLIPNQSVKKGCRLGSVAKLSILMLSSTHLTVKN